MKRRQFPVTLFALALILLIGFAVRVSLHDFFGLDGDDMVSMIISRNDPVTLITGLLSLRLDIHPPLHYLAIKGWIALTGDSLLALRSMNILLDMLTGSLIIRAAARLYRRRGGLIAGLLWSVAPTPIFAGYLVRMYTLLAFWVAAGILCIIEANSRRRRWLWLAGAALCGLGAIYTHSLGVIAFAALALAMLVSSLDRLRDALIGLACFALAGVLSLPYLGPIWNYYRSGSKLGAQYSFYNFGNPIDIPGTVIAVLITHRLIVERALILLIVPGMLILSALALRRFGKRLIPLLIAFWLAVIALSGLAMLAHIYKTFYLAPFAPLALILLTGIVLLAPRPLLRGLVLVALVVVSGWGTLNDLDHTVRDDPFAAAQFVESHERPGDMVLVAPDWAQELFKYHYHGSAHVIGVFQGISRDIDLDSILPAVTKGYTGVWVVRFQVPAVDPDNRLNSWFSAHAIFGVKVYPMNIPVSYYDLSPQVNTLPAYAHPLDALFGSVAALRGVHVPVTSGSARDTRLHPPSNWVQVILYWETRRPGANFVPQVRLTDNAGQVYGGELDDSGGADALHRAPVVTWKAGQIWEIISNLNLNPATPPGVYNIVVQALDPATGQPMPASGSDAGESWVVAGHFTVQ